MKETSKMEHKISDKKNKSLVYKNKKRTKKSKRNRVVHEYEKHISYLFKKMKLGDNDENISFRQNVNSNIFALESSMRNRLLKCNLKAYSSYSTSKSLNIYKKSGNKCIRFITIDKYLQGKVSCIPSFIQYTKSRASMYCEENHSNAEINKSVFTSFGNPSGIPKESNGIENGYGDFRYLQDFIVASLEKNNQSGMSHIKNSSGEEFDKTHFQMSDLMQSNQFQNDIFYSLSSLYYQTYNTSYADMCITNEKLFCTLKEVFQSAIATSGKGLELPPSLGNTSCNIVNYVETPEKDSQIDFSAANFQSEAYSAVQELHTSCNFVSYMTNPEIDSQIDFDQVDFQSDANSDLQKLNTSSQISQTILELFWLELKIKTCNSILKEFNVQSDDYKICKSSKKEGSDVIANYNHLLDEKNEPSDLIVDDDAIDKTNGSPSDVIALMSKQPFSISDHRKERRNRRRFTSIRTNKPKGMRRNCKRKRQDKEYDDKAIKRSKRLDECIMRASTQNKFPVRKSSIASNIDTSESNTGGTNKGINNKENDLTIASGCSESKNMDSPMDDISRHESTSSDLADGEINEILSELPHIDESLSASEIFGEESNDIGTSSETTHHDAGDGNIMVILPYVDINF